MVFLLFGVTQLGIAVIGTKNIRIHFTWYALLVLIVVYGLAYDNFAIAMGAFLEEGRLLEAINWPRHAIHALFTPMMIIASFGALRLAGVGFAQSRVWHAVICGIATVLILFGSFIDIINLDLVPKIDNNIIRYVNDFKLLPGPPIPAVLTILFVLVFGLIIWRKSKWPWLFIGAVAMFITAGAVGAIVVQNLGEIVFAGSLVATIIHTHRT